MRACGGCTLCCSILGVQGLKEPRTECPHQEVGSGCRIYQNRPQDCRNFRCAWRIEMLPVHLRPDHVGFVVEAIGTDQAFIHVLNDNLFWERPVQRVTDALRLAGVAVVFSRFQ